MEHFDRYQWHVVVVVMLLLVSVLLFATVQPTPAEQQLQSILPPPPNPFVIFADRGGRVYCGSVGGSVWLEIPSGFVDQGSAEFHCDQTMPLSEWRRTIDTAWLNRGYLIGYWPQEIPIRKSYSIKFEIDPARAMGICSTCFEARYYDPALSNWRKLPTTYNPANAQVDVVVSVRPPNSNYSGYEDRFLIALFVSQVQPTITTTKPTASITPSLTPKLPTPTPTPNPNLALTSTPIPSFTATTGPTVLLSPTLSNTATLEVKQTTTATPTPKIIEGNESANAIYLIALAVIAVLLLVIVVLTLLLVITFVRKSRG